MVIYKPITIFCEENISFFIIFIPKEIFSIGTLFGIKIIHIIAKDFQWKVILLKKKKMETFVKRNWLYFLGGIIGAISGYLYWLYVGCDSGTCPITSSPIASSIWGTIIGALVFNSLKKSKKNE